MNAIQIRVFLFSLRLWFENSCFFLNISVVKMRATHKLKATLMILMYRFAQPVQMISYSIVVVIYSFLWLDIRTSLCVSHWFDGKGQVQSNALNWWHENRNDHWIQCALWEREKKDTIEWAVFCVAASTHWTNLFFSSNSKESESVTIEKKRKFK